MERLFNIIRLPKRPLYKFLIMKVYFVFLLFIITNSCSEKNIGQLSSTDVASNNKNTNDVIPSQSQNPGEITLVVQVLKSFDSKMNICGQEKNNVVKIKVCEIRSHGQGIINLPLKNQELLTHFLVLDKKIEENILLELTAKESLCSNATDTHLSVLRYQILE